MHRILRSSLAHPQRTTKYKHILTKSRIGIAARHFSSAIQDPPSSSSSSPPYTNIQTHFNPTPEHTQLRQLLAQFTREQIEPQAHHFNKTETFNRPLFQQLHQLGLTNLTVPEEYGGAGMDATAVAIVHEEMSYSDPAFCLSYLAHEVLFGNNLAINGNDKQKSAWFASDSAPAVDFKGNQDADANGYSYIGGMCMSEPNAGTDVLGMQTKASPATNQHGQKGWTLHGQKMWITNGTLDGTSTGDVFLVYAKTGDKRTDVSQFIVQKGMDGFELGQQIKDKLGMRASPTAELVFDGVFVPEENLVGEVNEGMLCMMRNLEIERVALAAMAIGIARRCIDEMVRYSSERKAFGKEIGQFGQIQQSIAVSYAEYMAGKSYLYAVTNSLDLTSYGNGLDADGTKLYAAGMAKNVADRAIQVMGGYGYVGEYHVERLWRDAKLLEIGGGTNESHHKNMVRDLRKMGDVLP